MKFKNRRALITGAGRGIGRAIALAFAREGADVVLTARTQAELEEVRAGCVSAGVKAQVVAANLAQRSGVEKVFAAIDEARVDILVNNAGIGSSADPRPVIEYNDAFWEETLFVNLTVPYLLSKRVLPAMVKARHGRIINIASVVGKIGSVHGSAYTASKHGLLGLTKSLALEVVKEGITVNAICPGPTITRTNDKRIEYDVRRLGRSFRDIEAGMTPMGRRVTPEQIAPLAVFLASDEALVITGVPYNVDYGAVTT